MAKRDLTLVALLLPVAGAVALTCAAGPLPARPLLGLASLALAGAAWLAALGVARRRGAGVGVALFGALLLQGLALAGDPGTSDDISRYVWEGGLVLQGESPYAHAPAAPERAAERAAWGSVYSSLNHPEVSAAYPPLSQAAFAAAVALAGGPAREGGARARLFLRGLFALCALLVLLPLSSLARRGGGAAGPAIVGWGWCPLVPLELGGAGHLDALAILLLLAGLAAAAGGRRTWGAALLALGALAKLLPLLALPAVARGKGAAARWCAAGAVLAAAAGAVLLLGDGQRGIADGILTYAARWEGGSLVFRFVDGALRAAFSPHMEVALAARVVVGVAFAGIALHAWRTGLGPLRLSGRVIAAWLVLSPTLHPWYVCWIVPFVALRPRPAFAWLAAFAPLGHATVIRYRESGRWEEPGWVLLVLVLPFLALLLGELLRGEARA